MPRLPRLELPGVPLHVTQRGINKSAIFLDEEDRYHFRHLLRRAFRDQGIGPHAFETTSGRPATCRPRGQPRRAEVPDEA
jgi:hypothetical protein